VSLLGGWVGFVQFSHGGQTPSKGDGQTSPEENNSISIIFYLILVLANISEAFSIFIANLGGETNVAIKPLSFSSKIYFNDFQHFI